MSVCTCPHDVIWIGIVTQLAREQTEPEFLMHQLVGVQDFKGVLINDQE